jgi:3-deoxy-D-manno-octulosonic-acid transferase
MLKLIYNIIIIPIIYFFLIIVAGFSKKIYRSLKVREKILKNLKKKKIRLNPYKRTVLFHCSSMGEYKQVLPIVNNLRQSSVDYNIVLSLFSPSVYENIDNENELFDIITYIPFDFFLQTRNFINIINPDLVIISKHDIWPNFIWELYKREIPTYLVNALFADDTKMDKWYIKFFFKSIFSNLTGIITINEKHRQRFLKIFPYPDKLFISGDSRQLFLKRKLQMALNYWIDLNQMNMFLLPEVPGLMQKK